MSSPENWYSVIRADGFSIGPKRDIDSRRVMACRKISPMVVRLSRPGSTGHETMFAAVDLRSPDTSAKLLLPEENGYMLGIELVEEPVTASPTYQDSCRQFRERDDAGATHTLTAVILVSGGIPIVRRKLDAELMEL